MSNSDNSAQLFEIKRDLEFFKEAIQTVSDEILDNEVSNYPIFVAHKGPVELGRLILPAEQYESKWSISASLLEEFVNKGLIKDERLEDFKRAFKDPKSQMCVFAAGEGLSNFLFFPY
ncbi:MAG: hypothetical protein KDC92_07875 [Bacteroidetes bacterium]|nr:hypothetical protein [Bacteroidota bacterium]